MSLCGFESHASNRRGRRAPSARVKLGVAYCRGSAFGGRLAAGWIEDLAARSITAGCNAAPPPYCPTSPNTRGQMAVFLVKTFDLP